MTAAAKGLPGVPSGPWRVQVPRSILASDELTSAEKIHLIAMIDATKSSAVPPKTDEERARRWGLAIDTVRATRRSLATKGMVSSGWSERSGAEGRSQHGRYVAPELALLPPDSPGRQGFVETHWRVLGCPVLSPNARIVLVALQGLRSSLSAMYDARGMHERWRSDVMYAGSQEITAKTGLGRAAVLAAIDDLHELGVLTKVSRPRATSLLVVHEYVSTALECWPLDQDEDRVCPAVRYVLDEARDARAEVARLRELGVTIEACGSGVCTHGGDGVHWTQPAGRQIDVRAALGWWSIEIVRVALLGRLEAYRVAESRMRAGIAAAREHALELVALWRSHNERPKAAKATSEADAQTVEAQPVEAPSPVAVDSPAAPVAEANERRAAEDALLEMGGPAMVGALAAIARELDDDTVARVADYARAAGVEGRALCAFALRVAAREAGALEALCGPPVNSRLVASG